MSKKGFQSSKSILFRALLTAALLCGGTVAAQTHVTVNGNVFGGGNAADVGGTSTVLINQTGAVVETGVYGGCNTQGTVSGAVSVDIQNGTIGTSTTASDGVYGGGYGQNTATGDNVTVTIGSGSATPVIYGDVYGGSAKGQVNDAAGELTKVWLVKGTVHGDIYGGGLGQKTGVNGSSDIAALVNGQVNVVMDDGVADNVFGCNNLMGSPQTTTVTVDINGGTVTHNVYGGGNQADYAYSPEVNIDGGTVTHKVIGGGNEASVGGSTVNIKSGSVGTDGTDDNGVYGGCNNSGSVTGAIAVNVTGGTIGTAAALADGKVTNVFGGGYGYQTTTTGSIQVNISKATGAGAPAAPVVYGDVYGGSALGDVNTTEVNILEGSIEMREKTVGGELTQFGGNVYGGGLGTAAHPAAVNGAVTVNIGSGTVDPSTGFATSASGEATIMGSVYGCNNAAGSPKDNVTVNIFKTERSAKQAATYTANDREYALYQVFGGGNKAAYQPTTAGKLTTVHVYTCDNTINYVYGGGNAADVGKSTINSATDVIIDGGRMEWVFGGGNGYSATDNHNDPTAPNYNPGANIYGNASVTYHAGDLTYIFGGSNQWGNIYGSKTVDILADGSCTKHIAELYGGSNEAPTTGDVELTMGCSANTCPIDAVYGGSRNADITGDVVLTIEGGSYTNIFGGNNMGGTITGTVTLNLLGGTIDTAFGGNNAGGNITGKITVNMLNKGGSCPLTIHNIYGGGKNAAYAPTAPGAYTEVNLIHGSVTKDGSGNGGNVYGGGYGSTATVSSTPTVNVGYDASMATLASTLKGSALTTSTVAVAGNVYGGGEAAAVNGSTSVILYEVTSGVTASTTVSGDVFGGGNLANVSDNTDVVVYGGTVSTDVYGGGALANVGTDGSNHTNVTVNGGTVSRAVYGGGLGDNTHEALVNGAVQVIVNDGTVNDVYGCNNVNGRPTGTVRVDINNNVGGNVFGGGNLATYTGDPYIYINKGTVTGHVFGGGNGDPDDDTQVKGSVTGTPHVIVGDMTVGHESYQAIVSGDVYGGGNAAKVITGTPVVSVPAKCNTQITNVYGGGNAADVPATSVTIEGGTISGMVFGGGHGDKDATPSPIAANVKGNASVSVTGGTVNKVFGGSNSMGAISGTITVDIDRGTGACPMVITEVYGGGNFAASKAGTITIGCTGADASEYIGTVYGGANQADVTGDITLDITGGRINNVFGGNNNSGAIDGDITVNVEWTTTCSDNYLGNVYGAGNLATYSQKTAGHPAVNIYNGTVSQSVYGGGKGDPLDATKGVVTGNPVVTIGDQVAAHTAIVTGNVYGGGDAAAVTGNTTVNYNDNNASSSVANLFGGGNAAGVSGTATVTLTSGKVTTGLYGGCNSEGTVGGKTTVDVLGGTVGANGSPASVFGGGYGNSTATQGDVEVNINGADVTVWGDVYGGSGYGDVNDEGSDKTIVNILNGTVKGDVFGGGLGSTSPAYAAQVAGAVTVNIGKDNGDGTYSGEATIGGNVYGCNNTNGSPQQDVTVNIYKTAHTTTPVDNTYGGDAYAIANVFGGGKNADFNAAGKRATVNVYTCANTIGRVFGGGDAAAVTGSGVEIQGGRFNYVFGGGNGEVTDANVGTGGINLELHGGIIGTLVSGSNTRGTITGPINVDVDNVGGCDEEVEDFFGGSNQVDIATDVTTTIDCGAGTFRNVYGGSNAANITGNVVLNVKGGTMENLFGGSKGVYGGTAANIDGNVTLNLYGGTVSEDVFGGSNQNGNVTGSITVNVLDHEGTCALDVNNIYGAGNVTPYTPDDPTISSPTINVMHIKQADGIRGNVYGGGKGSTATVTANPHVNIGYNATTMALLATVEYPDATIDRNSKYVAKVTGSVFGGGNAAAVTGSTFMTMDRFNSSIADIYGGGNEAGISGNTTITLNDGIVNDGIYGGCNTTGTVGGDATIDLLGGTMGSVGHTANVFGGGFGQTTTVDGNVHITFGNIAGTAIPSLYGELYGGSALGSVNTKDAHLDAYNMNTVETTTIDLLSGTVNGNIFGGGLGQKNGLNGATSDIAAIVHGKIQINVGFVDDSGVDPVYDGHAVLRDASIYGCNNLNGTPQNDVFIDVYGTTRRTTDEVNTVIGGTYAIANLYGGGIRANYDPTYIYRKDLATIDAYLATQGTFVVNDSTRRPFVKKTHIYVHGCDNTIKELYAGGNAADVPGDSLVFDGGRFNDVFGGGNGTLFPANIGVGGVYLVGKGGYAGFVYEHCNKRGTITGGTTFVNGSGVSTDCNGGVLKVFNHFCGGNEVDILGNFTHEFTCENRLEYNTLYGGCRLGTTYGNITLIITGGNFGTIFGGPQGDPDFSAEVKKFPASRAEMEAHPELYTSEMIDWMEAHPGLWGTGGNVTIILKGGTIGNVYGGCDANGNVEGRITIIVDSTGDSCPLKIDNIYGGGNLAHYNPDSAATDADYAYPYISLENGSVKNNVYGGGKGSLAGVSKGLVTSNPYVRMHPDVANGKKFHVNGNLYGGGELGQVQGNTVVRIESGNVMGSVYGGGLGDVANERFGLIAKNTWVDMQNGYVRRSIYGGGELASVGTFTATYASGESPLHIAGEPKTCQTGTGVAKVTLSGNSRVGRISEAIMPPPDPDQDDFGYIFCGSRGDVDSIRHNNACKLAVVDSTYLEIGGNALVTASVYGGCENGQVLRNTKVKITDNCQIGIGYHKEGVTHVFDSMYTAAQWSGRNPANFHEVSHWPYRAPFDTYDPYAEYDGYYDAGHTLSSQGGNTNATNGHSFYGNVFGGGSGYYAIEPGTGVAVGTWRHSAGRVCGNTHVVVDGGHILNNIYGANELTDVLGSSRVDMSGGTLGVPRTVDSILARPLSGYLFGAGKGDQRTQFNKITKVQSTTVNVTGGRIFGSVFGGGEDGHVLGDITVNIDLPATDTLGTTGTSYVDGNVFGGGRGFSGDALTAGNVGGSITVNISSGKLLGSVYGGGRLASVGYDLCNTNEACYGVMSDDPNRGNITVNITGGTIGNDVASDYSLPHSRGGNVYGGSMGRLTENDGSLLIPIWHKLGSAKSTTVTINGDSWVKGNVYGGSELGTVTGDIEVNISGNATIGRKTAGSTSHGNVYGGGVGRGELTAAEKTQVGNAATSDSIPTFAGLTGGTINVNISGGAINNNVYGGGEMASVGTIDEVIKHTDSATTYYLSWPYEYTYYGTSGDARVNITGGTIGFISGGDTTGGDIYGSARGTVGDRYVTGRLSTARVTHVDINLTDPNDKIIGTVYGSGENGHVYDSAVVTLRSGLVLGSVYGGGKGVDKYTDKLKNPTTGVLEDALVYDIIAGKVFGNTYVNILGGRVAKNVYGGGNLASVGKGNYKNYGEGPDASSADSLLAENSGHCYVNILGGTIGPDSLTLGTAYNGSYTIPDGYVYGAGKGIVFPTAAKVGYAYDRNYYVAYVNKTFVVIGDSTQRSCAPTIHYPHVTANVFGGGENGHVRFDTYVQTNRGQVGARPLAPNVKSDQGHWMNRGNVFGAGRGEDLLPDGSYCQSAGSVTRNTTIDILGARVYRNVMGGGAMASVGPIKGRTGDSSLCVVNVRLPLNSDTIGGIPTTNNAFGGYIAGGSRGIPSPAGIDNSALATCHNSQVNFYRGYLKNTLYGGGENGQMLGNTEINVYGGYIRSAIYGGGKGSWKAPASETYDPVVDYSNDTVSGYICGNTKVNLLGGEVPFTYGGGRRASSGGNATINIGKDNGNGTYSGEASFIPGKDKVYGGNQYAGSPHGNIYVNVYKTEHTTANEVSGTEYAINHVYGGSYNSPYLPKDSGHYAQVHIYGCENTIDTVYGGCAAANVGAKPGIGANTKLIIDGGRFNAVFGGGDGTFDRYLGGSVPANIYGAAVTEIHGGTIGTLFGGSNFKGQADTIRISVENDGACGSSIEGDEFFGGSNVANLGPTELSTTLGCGVKFNAAYGGSNQADITGNVTLTIKGGEFGEVYAGSKGAIMPDNARQGQKDTAQADIDGNTHLIIQGGKIGSAYGGSNINGNITGSITVDVDIDPAYACTEGLNLDYVYGGSNLTTYIPDDPAIISPVVNLLNGTVDTNVFGGGKGRIRDTLAGLVVANPKVVMNPGTGKNFRVYGNIYGGGEMALTGRVHYNTDHDVSGIDANTGNTWVDIQGGTVGPDSPSASDTARYGNVYGGGRGVPGTGMERNMAYVNNTRVDISGNAVVKSNVYGGGDNGHIFDSTLVNIQGGTIGCGIRTGADAWLNTYIGNVYGAGRGVDYASNNYHSPTAGWVRGSTHVSVSGGHIHHNVYGGGDLASVGPRGTADVGYNNTYGLNDRTGRAWVEVTGGLIGICNDSTDKSQNLYGNVFGAGRGRSGVGIRYGNDWSANTYVHNAKVIVNYSNTALPNVGAETAYGTQHITGNVYGGGNNGHVNNSTSVTITRGRIGSHGAMGYGSLEGNIIGGGSGEEPFKAYLVRDGYYITNAQLASGTGHTNVTYNRYNRSGVNTYYATPRTHDDSLAVVDSLSTTAGLVYGNATVLVNGATRNDVQVKHHVYGGGSMASVGDYWIYPATVGSGANETETEGEIYPLTANNQKDCPTNHAGSNTATGICTVNITGGTFGTTGGNNGMIFGGCRGLEGNLTDITNAMAYFNDAYVTIGTTSTLVDYADPQILINGSVYGGSENGHGTGSTYVTIHDGKIGAHSAIYDRIKEIDDKVEDGTATAAEIEEMNEKLAFISNCGNVYGGGCGTDKYHDRDTVVTRRIGGVVTTLKSVVDPSADSVEAVYRYNPFCGVVYGNSTVVIDGGYVEHNVYGGGSMANVGRRVGEIINNTDASNSYALSWPAEVTMRRGTGYTNVTVSGNARIGYSGSDNGDIYGGARGNAGERYEMARYANVSTTNVTVDLPMPGGYDYTRTEKQIKNTVIKQYGTIVPLVAGSVYGGSENGQVIHNTSLTLTNGIVGHSLYGGGKGKGTYTTHKLKYKVADGVHAVDDDSTAVIYSLTAGKVFGNTAVTMTSGHVVRNIYGGGNLGSIGKGNYAGGVGDYSEAGYGERWPDNNLGLRDSLVNSGHAVVAVNGGYVGALNSKKDGLPTGNVFGGARGEAAPNDTKSPRYLYTPAYFLGYVNNTTVTIGSSVGNNATPQIYGSVYGGGEDGHVRGKAVVTVNDGVIGCQYNADNITKQGTDDKENIQWKLRGNVFGAGSGLGQYTDYAGNLQYNNASGSVTDSTVVLILGGQVARNVYGGGSFATVGPPKIPPITADPTYNQSHARVRITGGKVGYAPTDLANTATFYGGSVFGAGRGLPSDTYKGYCNVPYTDVHIASAVRGDVFGGAENGHVVGNTAVKVTTGATVGVGGTAYLQGNVFGGGMGSGEATDHDSDPSTPDEYRINKTCGRVGGNTTVTMDDGMIHGSIFGGGSLALTGVDNNGEYTSFVNSTLYDSINHGLATINVTGGTLGTSAPDTLLMCDWSTGDIMGSGKGDIDNYEDVLAGRVANTVINVSGSPVIRGTVFGGGEMASVGYWPEDNGHSFVPQTGTATVDITGGTIGIAYEYTVDPDLNPGQWTIYNNAKDTLFHTCTGNVFGGCQGDVDISAPHWISMGRLRQTSVTVGGTTTVLGKVFGGSEQGIVTENTHVYITGGTFGIAALSITPHTQIHKTYSGDIYAAGYGSDDPTEWDDQTPNDSTVASTAMGLGWETGLLSGRTFGNSRVDITAGTIYGSVYGGGSYASVGDDKSMSSLYSTTDYPINGVTTVNIGLPGTQADGSDATGSATIYGEVFGGNNFKGTPYGNTNVHIYKTAHTTANSCPAASSWAGLDGDASELTHNDIMTLSTTDDAFALMSVYGGGNHASHEPIDGNGSTLVHIHYCDANTVKNIYGGGNAANTQNNYTIVDGGRIYRVFGGGNGEGATNPGADVADHATTRIYGGLINSVFGGSNAKGNIGTIDLEINKTGSCNLLVDTTFGGGNEADGGGGVITVGCGTKVGSFYGGSHNANITGDMVLNIVGGTFEQVFGGSQGSATKAANIDGNVTINVTGGHIKNVFGGSDINGNITGKITVNIDLDPDYDCADGLAIENVYGGSKMALYQPTYAEKLASPEVNILCDSVPPTATKGALTFGIKNVYGGGLGDGTEHVTGKYLTGYSNSSPVVNIGGIDKQWDPVTNTLVDLEDHHHPVNRRNIAIIHGDVFGGGSKAPVKGNPTVILYSQRGTHAKDWDTTVVQGTVFGGGFGPTAVVEGSTTVGIFGDATVVEGNVYGGGNAGVLAGSTDVQVGFERAFTASQPTVSVAHDNKVTLHSPTPGATLRYTLDGTEPTATSTVYSGPFYAEAGQNVRAIAIKTGYDTSLASPGDVVHLPAPVITLSGSSATIAPGTHGPIDATIHYSLDGYDPTASSTTYSGGTITLSAGQVLKAIAVKTGYTTSPVATATVNP